MWVEIASKTHRSYADGITWINSQLEGFWQANPGCGSLQVTFNMIKPSDGGHPSLKCKAAQRRHLAPFAVYLAQRHIRVHVRLEDERIAERSVEYCNLAVAVATEMEAYHNVCAAVEFDAARCQAAMHGFLTAYHQLWALFRRDLPSAEHSSQPFGCRPKLHLCEHLVDEKVPAYGNPRLFWCYGDEDFVGLIKRIATRSKNRRTLENTLLAKYRLYASLHFIASQWL